LLQFEKIDIQKYSDLLVKFRIDAFIASFGNASKFVGREQYLQWLKEKITAYPDGCVLVKQEGEIIGQIECSIREYEERTIGYVHLFYIIPEMRGEGLGADLHQFAIKFFKRNHVNEYHLRVSPTNSYARKFYQRLGLEEIGQEMDGKVIRMKGYIED
jgi:RimJ/RimL family protein N-acetyltransferase